MIHIISLHTDFVCEFFGKTTNLHFQVDIEISVAISTEYRSWHWLLVGRVSVEYRSNVDQVTTDISMLYPGWLHMKQFAVDKNNAASKLPWTAARREPSEWVTFECENVNGGMLEFDQACFMGYFLMKCKMAGTMTLLPTIEQSRIFVT